jgi:hypothetical protein
LFYLYYFRKPPADLQVCLIVANYAGYNAHQASSQTLGEDADRSTPLPGHEINPRIKQLARIALSKPLGRKIGVIGDCGFQARDPAEDDEEVFEGLYELRCRLTVG